MRADQERVRKVLIETVTLLCKTGLQFENALRIQGVIGVTLDENNVFIVHVNETYEKQSSAAEVILGRKERVSGDLSPGSNKNPSMAPIRPRESAASIQRFQSGNSERMESLMAKRSWHDSPTLMTRKSYSAEMQMSPMQRTMGQQRMSNPFPRLNPSTSMSPCAKNDKKALVSPASASASAVTFAPSDRSIQNLTGFVFQESVSSLRLQKPAKRNNQSNSDDIILVEDDDELNIVMGRNDDDDDDVNMATMRSEDDNDSSIVIGRNEDVASTVAKMIEDGNDSNVVTEKGEDDANVVTRMSEDNNDSNVNLVMEKFECESEKTDVSGISISHPVQHSSPNAVEPTNITSITIANFSGLNQPSIANPFGENTRNSENESSTKKEMPKTQVTTESKADFLDDSKMSTIPSDDRMMRSRRGRSSMLLSELYSDLDKSEGGGERLHSGTFYDDDASEDEWKMEDADEFTSDEDDDEEWNEEDSSSHSSKKQKSSSAKMTSQSSSSAPKKQKIVGTARRGRGIKRSRSGTYSEIPPMLFKQGEGRDKGDVGVGGGGGGEGDDENTWGLVSRFVCHIDGCHSYFTQKSSLFRHQKARHGIQKKKKKMMMKDELMSTTDTMHD